jgi:hypothetical protein
MPFFVMLAFTLLSMMLQQLLLLCKGRPALSRLGTLSIKSATVPDGACRGLQGKAVPALPGACACSGGIAGKHADEAE